MNKGLYGTESMIPKFHWLLHYPYFLQKWKCLPACFVLERKHRLSKKYTDPVMNVSLDIAKMASRMITVSHLHAVAEDSQLNYQAIIIYTWHTCLRFSDACVSSSDIEKWHCYSSAACCSNSP